MSKKETNVLLKSIKAKQEQMARDAIQGYTPHLLFLKTYLKHLDQLRDSLKNAIDSIENLIKTLSKK